MNEILFPGLNLKFEISNVAFSVFNVKIYWYAILIVLCIIIAIIFMKKNSGRYNIKFEDVLNLMIYLIPISFIFARSYYVLFKLNYYILDPIKILNIRDGGLAIYGGIIGGTITIIVYCRKKDIKILDMLDYIIPYLALGQAIGRWGNFFNLEAYGINSTGILRMQIFDEGLYKEVHPTFLYESIGCLVIFLTLLIIRRKRKYSGQLTYTYLALYSFIRAIIEQLRIDSLMIQNIKISQALSIIIFIFSIIIIFYKTKPKLNIKNGIILAVVLLTIDQFTKIFAINKNIVLIPNVIGLNYIKNFGIAFGINYNISFIIFINIIVIVLILYAILKIYKYKQNVLYSLLFVLIGGIGNLIDRLIRGHVIDFINISVFKIPKFNFADMYIMLGVCMLIVQINRQIQDKRAGDVFLENMLKKKRL